MCGSCRGRAELTRSPLGRSGTGRDGTGRDAPRGAGRRAGASRNLAALQRRRPAGLAGRARPPAGWHGAGSPGPGPGPGAARDDGGGGCPGTDQGPNAAPGAGGGQELGGGHGHARSPPGLVGSPGGRAHPALPAAPGQETEGLGFQTWYSKALSKKDRRACTFVWGGRGHWR